MLVISNNPQYPHTNEKTKYGNSVCYNQELANGRDEQWRAEIRETALLLEAVASGDRYRVVKQLTGYLLAKNEEPEPIPHEAHDDDEGKEEEEHYEGDEDYTEDYAEGDDYQHDTYEYDEYGSGEYAAADEDYQEGPYMSGAYNEPAAANDTNADAYEGEYNYEDNYDPATDETGVDRTRQQPQGYQVANTQDHNYEYEEELNYEDQPQYTEDYYGQSENAYGGGSYNNQDAESRAYQGQTEAQGYGGGEWPQDSGYGLVSDDHIQVVDDAQHYEVERISADEGPPYQQDAYGAENPSYTEARSNADGDALHHEIQIFPDPDPDPYSDQTYDQLGQLHSEIQDVYTQQPRHSQHEFPDDLVWNQLPAYAEVQIVQNVAKPPLRRASAIRRTPSAAIARRMESKRKAGTAYEGPVPTPQGREITCGSTSGERESAGEDPEDGMWEDEMCMEGEEGLSPISLRHADLQFNPFSHQYNGPRLVMPMPPMGGGRMKTWEQ